MKNLLSWSSIATLILAAACWGLGTVISKGVLDHVPPLTLLVIQLVASLAFLWPIIIWQRLRIPLDRQTFGFALAGLLNPGLAYTFSLVGLVFTTATMSALLWAAEPILILGLAWLILRERLTRPLLLLSLLAISGVVLVIGLGSTPGDSGSFLGNLLVLAGVFCCAIYTVLTRRMVTYLDPVLLTALQQSIALLWAILIWPVELWGGEVMGLAGISSTVWLGAVASGIIYYALAFWFYIIALKQAPASLAALFLNLIPVFAVSGAYIFLGERLGLGQWLGAGLILLAVMGIFRFHRHDEPVSTIDSVQSQEMAPLKIVNSNQ